MRIALVGNHPDGWSLASALESGGSGSVIAVADIVSDDLFPNAERHSDIDDLVARSDIDLVIIAGPLRRRGPQLRRALQSKCHALCVSIASDQPDLAYEASLIQTETKKMALPIVPSLVHPSVEQMRSWLAQRRNRAENRTSPPTVFVWRQTGIPPLAGDPLQPDWHLIRNLGGDIAEVVGFSPSDGAEALEPITFSGRFQDGSLLQGLIDPSDRRTGSSLTVRIAGESARLSISDIHRIQFESDTDSASGSDQTEPTRDQVWLQLAGELLASIQTGKPWRVTWQDEIRVCEWADALHRSLTKRRISTLDYQEINEEVGSKGTLTLIGCGMVWVMLLLAFLAIWQPLVLWGVLPLIGLFLALVIMNWLAQKR